MGKVRIYDLAKELKLESKRVLEDARRLGVDVSVPSNTLDENIAAKIREMYYPKKEQTAAPRSARLIKHHPGAGPAPMPAEASAAPMPVASPSTSEKAPAPVPTPAKVEPIQPPAPAPAPTPPVVQQSQHSTPQANTAAQPAIRTASPSAEPRSQAPVGDSAKPRIVKLAPQPAPPKPEPAPVQLAPEPVPVEVEAAPPVIVPEVVAPVEVKEPEPVAAEAPRPPAPPAPPAPPVSPAPPAAVAQPAVSAEAKAAPTAPPTAVVARSLSPVKESHDTKSTGTKVIKLVPPTKPMPKPQPKPAPAPAPAPAQRSAQRGDNRFGSQRGGGRQGQDAQRGTGRQGHEVQRAAGQPEPQRHAGGRMETHRQGGRPNQGPQGRPQLREAPRGDAHPGGGKDVHILPSGAQQRTVYIPPKDQRPKGRHQVRKDKEKEKEGQQKVMPRRQAAANAAARALPVELKPVRLVEGSTVREFAEKIEAKPRDIVTMLMQRGVMATINQTISPDVAKNIGRDYGFDVSFGDYEEMIIESEFEITPEAMADTDHRAPVVTVMGHVDHGKTSLLDAIREARVAEGEAGGITQHIGAYSVQVPNPDSPSEMRRVVFLDTPGHEAFTMMRARGAKVTDIVVLVVAADDGVMPQTVEAIEHAKAAEVPIIVAINKIDKPDANPERVKKELADRGLLWDNWGGQTTMVEVSAKKKQNITGLLEMILLTADLLELKANPKRMATGTVLEAKLDRGRGAVATVLIQNGTLRVGEPLIVGNYFGKVRALMNEHGDRVQDAGPATPVEVLGLEGVPAAGDQFQVVDDVIKAQQISQFRQSKARTTALARTAARGLDQLAAQLASGEVKELLVILKADVQGSYEVLKETLVKLSTEKVKVRIIRSGVGAITESDVLQALVSNATAASAATTIIGFNVRPESRAEEIAKQEGVDIRLHSVIYKVEEEIRNAMLGLLDATLKEVVIGKAEVRDVIRVPKVGSVAGCMVINGSIKRTAHARLIRDNVVIFENNIGSLRRFKDDVSEVQQGYECGITVDRFNDYKVGDVIEAFVTEKVAPTKLE